jgi:hypothetical protein
MTTLVAESRALLGLDLRDSLAKIASIQLWQYGRALHTD